MEGGHIRGKICVYSERALAILNRFRICGNRSRNIGLAYVKHGILLMLENNADPSLALPKVRYAIDVPIPPSL